MTQTQNHTVSMNGW